MNVLRTLLVTVAVAIAVPAWTEEPLTEEQKTLYFLGVVNGKNLGRFDLTDEEVGVVMRGFQDELAGKAMELDPKVYGERLKGMMAERASELAGKEKAASQAFLDEAAAREGARKLDSGLIIQEIQAGTGESPTAASTVRVHYTGKLRNGAIFDSSVERGQPFETPLSRVVPCWQEGVLQMKVGGKAYLYCPSDLAYGDRGTPGGIPGGAALFFEVELLAIVK